MKTLIILSAFIMACGGAPTDDGAEPEVPEVTGPESRLFVIQTMGFAKERDDGTVAGFNVDGVTSEDGDPASCGHADWTSPDGTPGIDNQLAGLVPLLELAGLGAAESLIQSTIEDGGILIMLQIDGIDDLENDDQVTFTVRAGKGVPLLGTDGLVLSGQTFSVHPESPDSVDVNARIENGIVHAGPFAVRLPLLVFGMTYELNFHDTRITAVLIPDGGLELGVLGGGVPLEDLYAIGETAAKDDASVLPAIKAVVGNAGDLAPDDEGACQQISGAFEFGAVSAFFFPEDTQGDPSDDVEN
jgi:hypothetical protein